VGVIRNRSFFVAGANEIERLQHSSGMVPMSVGEHDALDQIEVQAEPARVALERISLRSTVEEYAVLHVSAGRRDQQRKAVARAAKRVTGQFPHPVPL